MSLISSFLGSYWKKQETRAQAGNTNAKDTQVVQANKVHLSHAEQLSKHDGPVETERVAQSVHSGSKPPSGVESVSKPPQCGPKPLPLQQPLPHPQPLLLQQPVPLPSPQSQQGADSDADSQSTFSIVDTPEELLKDIADLIKIGIGRCAHAHSLLSAGSYGKLLPSCRARLAGWLAVAGCVGGKRELSHSVPLTPPT